MNMFIITKNNKKEFCLKPEKYQNNKSRKPEV